MSKNINSENFARLKSPPSTIICREKTSIIGEVTIGTHCVIHPTAVIIAENGPIIIGNNNLIEERVNIINNRAEPMTIGDDNVFEVDSWCEATRVGNNNILESKSHVGSRFEITNNCIVGAGCKLTKQANEVEVLQQNTVITGSNLNRRIVTDLPASSHTSQLDFLRKILPNYQKLWRPANQPLTPQQPR